MKELKFKVGDVVADNIGTIGTVLSLTLDTEFPYRIGEDGGGWGLYRDQGDMRLDSEVAPDPVSRPAHYTGHPSGVECIQITEHMGFNLGNVIKYLWRADEKGRPLEDLEKAAWYLDREIERRQNLRP